MNGARYLRALMLLMAAAFSLLCPQLASSLDARTEKPRAPILRGYTHLAFTGRDGAPGGVTALAQSKDRYIWVGTALGLYRFDGARFSQYPFQPNAARLPVQDVAALTADPIDGVWIGYRLGGVSHLSSNGLKTYGRAEGLTNVTTDQVICAPNGIVWTVSGGQIWRLENERWINFSVLHGLTSDGLLSLFIDSRGTMWTADQGHIYYLRAGESTFREYKAPSFYVTQFFEPSPGDLWVSDGWRSVRSLSKPEEAKIPVQGVSSVLHDRNSVWIAEDYYGLLHAEVPAAGADPTVTSFTQEDGLSSQETRAFLKDDEGNLWVGTQGGLDRFRASDFSQFVDHRIRWFPGIGARPGGGIVLGSLGEKLYSVQNGTVAALDQTRHGAGPMCVDGDGGVWLHDFWSHAVVHASSAGVESIEEPFERKHGSALAIAVDANKRVLISFEGRGLWQIVGGKWSQISLDGLSDEAPTSILADGTSVWLGYRQGGIALISGSHVKHVEIAVTDGVGKIVTLQRLKDRIWVGGSEGVMVIDPSGARFRTFPRSDQFRGVSGILEDDAGNVWLNGGAGVVLIREPQLERFIGKDIAPDVELYDARYGIDGAPAQIAPTPSAVKDASGLLWFGTAGNLYSVDPRHLHSILTPPGVAIEGLDVDGRPWDFAKPLRLPFSSSRSISVHVAAKDFTSPERVRYRYRLASKDAGPFTAVDARTINFAGLAPGAYTFSIAATNGNERWSSPGSLSFVILPAWYQTWWCFGLCLFLLAALMYAGYLYRVRRITGRMRELMEERMQERFRIARDLHDTLLQAVQGLMLRVQGSVQGLPPDEPARQELEDSMFRADLVVLEARQCVQQLRHVASDPEDFGDVLLAMGKEMSEGREASFALKVEGIARSFQPLVQDELCRIAKEAISNSFHHARASQVETILIYNSSVFKMICRDDGKGMDAEILKRGGRAGHWGLTGMNERACSIDAKFSLTSSPEAGTEVAVLIQGTRAYTEAPLPIGLFSRFRQRHGC